MKRPNTVDEYIKSAPEKVQGKLKEIRKAIKSVVPNVPEKISYSMPFYGYKGYKNRLAYFAYAKKHIGLYVMPPVIQEHRIELKDYKTSTATIQFPLDEKLPIPLIKKLILAAVKNNEAKSIK